MKLVPTAFTLCHDGEHPINGERSTHVRLCDEGGGSFITITQWFEGEEQNIRLDFDEIELLVKATKGLKGSIND